MAASPTQPGSGRSGSMVVRAAVAIVLTAVNLRTAVTGFTPLLEMMGAALGFGVTVAGLLGTLPAVAFAVFGVLAPVVTRRFGLERTVTLALGFTALALVLRALAPTPLILVISTVLALAGIGAANVVIVPLVKVWFPDRLALWTSIYLISMQAGQFVAPLIAVPIAHEVGWRVSIGMWAALAAIAALVWVTVTIRLPRGTQPAGKQAGPSAGVRVHRSATVWGLVGVFAVTSFSNYGVITWVPAMLTEAGASAALGGTMVALYSAWGVVSAFVVPAIATRMANPYIVVVVCAAALVAGYLGLLFAPLNGIVLWVCLLGVGVSMFPLCMTLINRRTKTPQTASAVSGFVQGVGYALACFGPIGLGLLRQATGSWSAPLLVLAATAVPALIAGWFACRPRFVEDAVAQGAASVVSPRHPEP